MLPLHGEGAQKVALEKLFRQVQRVVKLGGHELRAKYIPEPLEKVKGLGLEQRGIVRGWVAHQKLQDVEEHQQNPGFGISM
eukprot:7798428-Alexandrium_andersonii.AAC.1